MNRKWLLILFVGILILSLAACTGSTPTTQSLPTPTTAVDTDMDADESHDDSDTDADEDDADSDEDADPDADADADGADDDSADEAAMIDAAALFSTNCARCHGEEREGGGGPPLLPANLTKDPSAYVKTITEGSGPMPTWGGRLSEDEINALVDFILSDAE